MSRKNVLKIAVIGKERVGKSALCNAMAMRTINRDYDMSIGVDLILTYFNKNNNNIQLSLWDMAGHSRFDTITDTYIDTMKVLLFCYSSDKYRSFKGMIEKHNSYSEKGLLKGKHVIVTMCKSELTHQFPNSEQMGKDFADNNNYIFIKTSAFKKEGLEELKEAIVNLPEYEHPPTTQQKLYFKLCTIL